MLTKFIHTIQMPNLVSCDLRIQDARCRRVKFRLVRINQIFYSRGRWYQKRSARRAIPADDPSYTSIPFKYEICVRVFDEFAPPNKAGLTYEQFVGQAAL